ncbi:MAG: TraB/GumN family protein [Bacteroidota bacterium]
MSGKGLDKDSYLFGTIHIIEEADYFLPKNTLSSFENVDQVVFEINMEDMTDMGQMMSIIPKTFMNDGVTLADLLEDEEYKFVKSHFEDMGLPMFMLEKMKPMFLSVLGGGGGIDPQDFMSGSMKSYEMELYEMGKAQGKSFDGLETIDFQISVFDSIPYKDQAEMLVESLKAGDTGASEFKETVEIYKTQNLAAMISMVDENEQYGEYEDILLTKRNKAWIPKMKTAMSENSNFFAVGAAHLGGKNGVVYLLRKEGYTLTPLSL